MAKRKPGRLAILSPNAIVQFLPGVWTMRPGTILRDTVTNKVYRYEGDDVIAEVEESVAIGAELGEPATKSIQ